MDRTRLVQWDDPNVTASMVGKVSGLEFMQAIIDKRWPPPPISRVLDFDLVAASEGRAVFEGKPQEIHYNPTGSVHGGYVATLLDSALGCAVFSMLPAGVGYTTAELHVNLVRAITKDTPRLRAEATIVHKGRTVCTSQATLKDATGKLYAHGTSTCVILTEKRGNGETGA